MFEHDSRWRGGVLLVALLAVVGACGRQVTRTLVPPGSFATLDQESPYLKAHRADGGVYVLTDWSAGESGAISGTGSLLDANRETVGTGDFLVPLDSVVLFETNVEGASGAATALTLMAGVTAVVAGICAASPKTCFGSCPTFYAPGQDGTLALQAEGFSSSIAPALEATDVDMLLHSRPTARDYTVRVTNEAFETHVIRHADILAVPRPQGGRAYVTSGGSFLQTTDEAAPTDCRSPGGGCVGAVATADGREYFSLADSADLTTKETIELVFDEVPDGPLGLVVVSRQTLMTTFLIYQALAYMGEDAGRWLAMLETGGQEARDLAGGVGRVLGNIEVLTLDDEGRWIAQGELGETGPIAADTRLVPLGVVGPGPVRVRLRLTRGMWRLDRIALAAIGDEAEPTRLYPTRVERDGVEAAEALRALVDREEQLVTMPGDSYDVSYRLPEDPEGYQLFLEARGYYLEWMRQEWMSEQNPLLAAMLVADPAYAMKALAGPYKEQEPTIEEMFWNSRYVRH